MVKKNLTKEFEVIPTLYISLSNAVKWFEDLNVLVTTFQHVFLSLY